MDALVTNFESQQEAVLEIALGYCTENMHDSHILYSGAYPGFIKQGFQQSQTREITSSSCDPGQVTRSHARRIATVVTHYK